MRVAGLLPALALLAACHRETREVDNPPVPFSQSALATTTTVIAGGAPAVSADPTIRRYETNAWHVSEGQRLYTEFNCVECHAYGGGGIGVPLIDQEWIYGSSSPQIVATLIQGRPNGMPSYRRLLTEQQMWQLAAYVRSIAGRVLKDVPPSRGDTLSNTEPMTQTEAKPPHESNQDAGAK